MVSLAKLRLLITVLNEEEAKKMGNGISEQGITCVIKQVKFSNELKDEIEQQNYEIIIKELSS